jgi:AcrR family transcriptional regulator
MASGTQVLRRVGAMRSDAQRSRRGLLDAARALFVEVGIEVPLEAIARRAGVGIATLYRHFPNRRALVTAVAVDVLERTEVEARAAIAEEPDGFAALRRYMHRALDACAPAIMPLLTDEVRRAPAVKALLNATASAQGELIASAQQQGSLREGVDFADIGLALARFSRPLGHGFDPALESAIAHRHLDVFIDGLRHDVPLPLSGPALTLQNLRAMQRRNTTRKSQV